MPVCDGVEAAKRLRLIENKRKSSTILPSQFPWTSIWGHIYSLPFLISCSPQRRLPGIYETALFKRWNECLFQQTSQKE